jgi:hypothetical protein
MERRVASEVLALRHVTQLGERRLDLLRVQV